MIVVFGGFGKTAQAALTGLLGRGESVRLVSRSARQAPPRGVELAVADLSDEAALGRAVSGARAVYALLPDDLTRQDFRAARLQQISCMSRAIRREGIRRVVLLSAVSAALGENANNGFGADLAYFERQMLDTRAEVSILRASYFQDNVLQALPFAEHNSTFLNCWSSREVPITTVAATDVGAFVARALLETRSVGRELVDVVGPTYTASRMAADLGDALGRSLNIEDISRPQQTTLFGRWMSGEAAAAMVETLSLLEAGRVPLNGDRRVFGTTRLDQVLKAALSRTSSTSSTHTAEVSP